MRRIVWLLAACAALVLVVTFLPLDLLRPRIERALEQGLGRKVEISGVHFTLLPGVLPGPGFTLDGVTIHEDPRAGIEPFAYMDSLGASVRLRSLFTRRLEFSLLNLGDATINIVKSAEGPWNFQHLLAGASTNPRAMPSIRMRGGRVNFKFGDTKSVFYFNDADLDVAPHPDGSLELRFGGAPSRTDHAAQEFGRLFVRGNSSPGYAQLNFSVELERSSLQESLRWFAPGGTGVHGNVALQAQLSGSPSRLSVNGKAQLTDVHRWDLLPTQGGGWQLPLQGSLDLVGERLDVKGPSTDPVNIRLHAEDWLRVPQWSAAAEARELPLDTVLKIARHMGAGYPEQATAEGTVSGTLEFARGTGLAGKLELRDALLALPDTAPLSAPLASVEFGEGVLRLARTNVRVGENQNAEVEAVWAFAGSREWEARIATRGLEVKATRSLVMASIPSLRDTPVGSWRGAIRYKAGAWAGEFELRGANVSVDGLAEPLKIDSATVTLNGDRVVVSRLRGQAAGMAFAGSYRYEPSATRPHKFAIAIPEADASTLQELLAPMLPQPGGILSRTLGLGGSAAAPAWLAARHAEGSVTMESLVVGDLRARNVSANLLWDGTTVRVKDFAAKIDPGAVSGAWEIDLAGRSPSLRFEGQAQDMPWRGGGLDLEGVFTADAAQGVHAEGKLRGRGIAFAPEAELRAISAAFEVRGLGAQSRWTLTNVEANQAGEVFTGTGGTQADGRLALDLSGRGRQVHWVSTVSGGAGAP